MKSDNFIKDLRMVVDRKCNFVWRVDYENWVSDGIWDTTASDMAILFAELLDEE